jgi:DhnA family fructose-bisphosphate aldolase class Ia
MIIFGHAPRNEEPEKEMIGRQSLPIISFSVKAVESQSPSKITGIEKDDLMSSSSIRLNKLFSHNQPAVVIAIDHGYMDGPIPGMENLPATIQQIDPCVDAILLSPGMLKQLGSAFDYKGAPIPIVRLNWSTVFCFEWGYNQARTAPAFTVKEAIGLGAEIVLISLTLKTGDEANDAHNVEIFSRLRAEAAEYGIPVVGECFPNDSDHLSPDELHDQVLRGTRILAELGADLIKTFRTRDFPAVVQGCPIPILGLGGHATPNPLDSLELAHAIIAEGARGVVFGRNAIQRPDPRAYQRALCDVVKRGIPSAQALKIYHLH